MRSRPSRLPPPSAIRHPTSSPAGGPSDACCRAGFTRRAGKPRPRRRRGGGTARASITVHRLAPNCGDGEDGIRVYEYVYEYVYVYVYVYEYVYVFGYGACRFVRSLSKSGSESIPVLVVAWPSWTVQTSLPSFSSTISMRVHNRFLVSESHPAFFRYRDR